MAGPEPLRISCDDCPGGPGCDDCLVGFFLDAGDAQVLRFGPPGAGAGPVVDLEPDLAAALRVLLDAGLEPRVVATRRSAVPRAS